MTRFTLPISPTSVIRLLLFLVVILALGLGYYHNRWEQGQKQLQRLQTRYTQLEKQLQTKP